MKSRGNKRVINCIFIIFLILSSTILFNNKTIEKEAKSNNLKALEQEGNTYRLVTSADNVQVPVPKGYVASQVTGENYVTPEYQHTQIQHKGNYTELTWSSPSGEQYPWTQDSNGIWISGNQGIENSESVLESEEFDYIKGTTLTINYTYSCKWNNRFILELIDLTNNITTRIVSDIYGNTSSSFDYITSNYTYTISDWTTGRYKIRAIYCKYNTIDSGQDSAYIKASTFFKKDENGTETFEEDIKTKIHDGGFVIYQLTDEELEIDPNGTSVVINDTNKDEAQSSRNQYVWVPLPNIEDIVRTKIANNGIMQFGQNYTFGITSVEKDIKSSDEPRLVKSYDMNKYYLQRYSNNDKREDYLSKMQEEYVRMIKSTNKYKGFYIGRYETGDDYIHSYDKGCFINPKIVRYNSNISHVTWFDSYKDLERLSGKTEKYVETGMIYDSLWDYTLIWLNETDARSYREIRIDSGTWGNYINNTKTTQSGGTGPARTGAIETITYRGKTYSDSPTSSNNIFDIAGNVWEWTTSGNNLRKIRGGNYYGDSNSDQAYDSLYNYPSAKDYFYGSRCFILIK